MKMTRDALTLEARSRWQDTGHLRCHNRKRESFSEQAHERDQVEATVAAGSLEMQGSRGRKDESCLHLREHGTRRPGTVTPLCREPVIDTKSFSTRS